jgi:twinkle protein
MEASIININDILSFKEIPMETVYDIEVEDNHNFYIATNTAPMLVHNSGKSDWVDEMCIGYNAEYGWKTAYASPENKPNVIHAAKLEAKICGQWVNRQDQISSDWHRLAKEFIDNNFKFIDLDSYDLDEVLERAKRLVRKFGIKVLVIDPYNKVRLKASLHKNVNEYTNDYLIKIDDFARKYDVLPILVAHPVKPSGDDRKTYRPDFYSIKGGGEFYDMSPHGLLVHRNFELDMVEVTVLKVKFAHLGENKSKTWFQWNRSNGRYSEYCYQSENPEMCSNLEVDNDNWLIAKENDVTQKQFDYNPNQTIQPNYNFESETIADVPF